jgi:hypothetical protein
MFQILYSLAIFSRTINKVGKNEVQQSPSKSIPTLLLSLACKMQMIQPRREPFADLSSTMSSTIGVALFFETLVKFGFF